MQTNLVQYFIENILPYENNNSKARNKSNDFALLICNQTSKTWQLLKHHHNGGI